MTNQTKTDRLEVLGYEHGVSALAVDVEIVDKLGGSGLVIT